MSTAFAFRLSIYATLILSSVCLGYSEWDYLPEVTAFTGVVVLAIVLASFSDKYGRHLSLLQANLAGALIFALAATWYGFHYFDVHSPMNTLPWPAGGLPYLAPLLMLLIPAKLFRPKRTGDWWALYGISLACVSLAIAMAEDGLIVLLVLLYATAAVWSLTLFFFHRALVCELPTLSDRAGRGQFPRSLLWMATACVVALPLFFLTPRTAGVPWELFKMKMETGLSESSLPDLGRTGYLKPNHEVAFEVYAKTLDGQPKTDLPVDQRWRGTSLTKYQSPRGRWDRRDPSDFIRLLAAPAAENWRSTDSLELPDLGPNSYQLEFRLVSRAGVPIFADPVAFVPGQRPPIAAPMRGGIAYVLQNWDASFVFPQPGFRYTNRYMQITRGRDDKGREPISSFRLLEPNNPATLEPFLEPPPPAVADYARKLLAQCFRDGTLPRAVRNRMNAFNSLHPDDYAAVAEVFRLHLSFSGGFTYTLNLRLQDRNLDPIEDFLFNTRSGHCERFATALVLMLRAVDIPSQLALGYRGCDQVSNGHYVVRQEDAHAWAEVLLPRTTPAGREWYWQAFDATPITGLNETEESGLIESSTRQGQRLFAEFVIGLNPDSQRRLTAGIADFFAENWPWLAAVPFLLAGLLYSARRLLRWRRTAATDLTPLDPVPWYTRLVAILHGLGLPEISGETPREFAIRASEWLKARPATAEFAVVPLEASKMVYSQRYAERTPDPNDIEALTAALDRIR